MKHFDLRRTPKREIISVVLLLGLTLARCAAGTEYTVSLANPEHHLVEVQIILPAGSAQRELQLPVWNALYQVRDFAQYVNWVRAKDRAGRPLTVQQLTKSRWQVSGAESGTILEYQIYMDSFGPFGAQLNSHHAFFNLAQLLIYPVDARSEPMSVRFNHLPEGWRIATPLAFSQEGRFSAENYDRLVDSPVEIGTFKEADFDEAGGHYRVVIDAEAPDYDMDTITTMLRKIVAAATSWMGDRPFDNYMFLYHFPHGPAGGGMEHSYSTAIDVNADVLSRSPEALASVTAHEFFHLWNVKRIRPQTLEPVDYTRENYTRALWFSEGCTSTAADIIQLRSGLLDELQFEQELASGIGELERRPAHLTQSAEASSLDAWLEGNPYYRRPERSISYYNKGELLGIVLDLAVRDSSHWQTSLREVFQWMNENYAKKGKFFPDSDGVREAAEAVSHADLGWFFAKYVQGTDEIPWNDFFRAVGLRVIEGKVVTADAGFVSSRNFDGPMAAAAVTAGSEAERAGLRVGDIILEINGRIAGQESSQDLVGLTAGDTITVKLRSRGSVERELKWKAGSHEEITYELKNMEKTNPEQMAHRAAWLKGEAQVAPETHSH
ncbi:MAG TPA: PDZ domain-containing protein [Candidatus Acidoferrales bacterium]|nr:PDZ domain-containing protein [Candidatus Acidoferrales bacterium]